LVPKQTSEREANVPQIILYCKSCNVNEEFYFVDTTTPEYQAFKTRYVTSSYQSGAPFDSNPMKGLQGRIYDTTILSLRTLARVIQVRITCANAKVNATYYNPAILAVNHTLAEWCVTADPKLTYLMSRNVTFVGACNNVDLDANGDVQPGTYNLILKSSNENKVIGVVRPNGKVDLFPGQKLHFNGKSIQEIFVGN